MATQDRLTWGQPLITSHQGWMQRTSSSWPQQASMRSMSRASKAA